MLEPEMLGRIRAVDPIQAETLASYPAESTESTIPPYRRLRLVRVSVVLPHRFIDLFYMTDGQRMHKLGDTEGVYAANRAEELYLGPMDVVPYLRFFLFHAVRRSMQIVESPDEARWTTSERSSADELSLREQAEFLIRPAQVRSSPDGVYDVAMTVIDQRALSLMRLRVWRDGRVEQLGSNLLLAGIPVPYTGS